jgi:hypothetical protein
MIIKFKLFENYSGGFTIPEKIQDFYKISGDISNVSNWKAKVILNNNSGRGQNVGDFGEVGYIMVNYTNSDIIPISRSDEHQRGEELLYHLWEKRLIDNINYTPIFWGNNYFSYNGINDKQIAKDLVAVKKYLEYGGDNTILSINWRYKIDLKTFIALDGDLSNIEKYVADNGSLTNDGEYFIMSLERLAKLFRDSIMSDKNYKKDIIEYTKDIKNEYLKKIDFMSTFNIKKELDKGINLFDINLIQKVIYSHNGLKNKIHIMLKNKDPKLKEFFGNLDLALSRFDYLSSI